MTHQTLVSRARAGLRAELRPLLQLAGPVVAAEVGWMTMGLVDSMMVGRVSPEALGAVGLGGSIFFTVALFGMGLLFGMDYTVAHAFAAGEHDDAHRWLVQGAYLALLTAIPGIALLWWSMPYLAALGVRPEVLRHAVPYSRALSWSLLPLLLLTASRRYLQATNVVMPIMVTVVSANLINVGANWVLVFGHLGSPALGAEGSGWATCLARVYMATCLIGYMWWRERGRHGGLLSVPRGLDRRRFMRLLTLGLPAAVQMALECGVFAAVTTLAARLDASALAGSRIALNAASFTFMVPLGISAAAAVRVGQALGRRQADAAAHAGSTALLVGGLFMISAGVVFLAIPAAIVRVFTADPTVIAIGATLVIIAAVFQLFDGIQVVATGALRGTGDTRTALLSNLIGHWLLGLPLGYLLCFKLDWGVIGLWIGLCVGLVAVATVLLVVWTLRVRELAGDFRASVRAEKAQAA
ncbi:MAG: MATE family efflux transporter [Deltaproteobacteria bacterium]|nr:MATE family efflux transporter [Deltaproteobacteria bacterium]MBI3389140.1 MATE family efflux transporter [Deltaproteobacteria bacterium]